MSDETQNLTARLGSSKAAARALRTAMAATALLLVTGCGGGQLDLYDYLGGDSQPSSTANAPATAGQPLTAPPAAPGSRCSWGAS